MSKHCWKYEIAATLVIVLTGMLAACAPTSAMDVTFSEQQTDLPSPSSATPAPEPAASPAATPVPSPTASPSPSPTLTPKPAATPSGQPEPTPENYESYLGSWISSDTAKTRGEVFDQGGSAIQFTKITGCHAVGNVVSVSESPGHRDARVDFDGTIEDGILLIVFDDDGWNSTGAIIIEFAGNRLQVNMVSNISDDNLTGWNIGYGDYVYYREA
jgi:hypothetical protein